MSSTILEQVDEAFQLWGRAAPPMRAGENERRYIERVSRIAQKKNYLAFDEPARKVDFSTLPASARPQFESMLLEGIKRSVSRADTVPDGEMRARHVRNDGGGRVTEWVGPRSFVRDFTTPCRLVTRINAPQQQVLYQNRAHMNGLWG